MNEAEQHEGRGKGSGDVGRLVRHAQSPSEKRSAQCRQGGPSETLNYIEVRRRHRQVFFLDRSVGRGKGRYADRTQTHPADEERTYEQGEGHAVAGKKKERQCPG